MITRILIYGIITGLAIWCIVIYAGAFMTEGGVR